MRGALDVGLDVNGVLLFEKGSGPSHAHHDTDTQDVLAKLVQKIGWDHLYIISWCGRGNVATYKRHFIDSFMGWRVLFYG